MKQPTSRDGDNIKLAVFAIVFTELALSLGDATIKHISANFPLWQIFVIRSMIAVPILIVVIKTCLRSVSLIPQHVVWTTIRSLMLTLMWVAYYSVIALRLGAPVKGNATIRLKHMSGQYVVAALRKKFLKSLYNYPRLGDSGAINLRITSGKGNLVNGATIELKSTEKLPNGWNKLGAFAVEHDCYYYRGGYGNKQRWRVVAVDPWDGLIHFGQRIRIVNVAYHDQNLIRNSNDRAYLTRGNKDVEWWTIEEPR